MKICIFGALSPLYNHYVIQTNVEKLSVQLGVIGERLATEKLLVNTKKDELAKAKKVFQHRSKLQIAENNLTKQKNLIIQKQNRVL